jgi:ATP-binding cassette subfamily F protein 3
LSGLGFQEEQFSRPVKSFSGGEKTRIGLARILVREYPLLFLDEPTNHLDLDSVEWLEAFLKDYPGALLVISHDRYFLDHVTETTFDLENGKLKRYLGGYSRYALQKEEDRKAEARAFEKQQKEIAETEAYILRYKAGIKSKQARGRQTRLERLERLEKPGERRAMSMGYADILMRTGEKVLTVDQISFGYADSPDNLLLSGVSAEIREGERVALLGPNGVGKTTILKLITGRLKPRGGGIYLGPSVKPAYFDQEHQNLHSENTVLHEILDHYDLTVEETKGLLARFLFFAEDIDKKVSSLSGGEQGRLSLLKLTLEKGNFLVLDEPTNHLDIQSREIMEDYLIDFPGALLMVSHDRYFIDTLADRVLELTPGGLISYQGNYTEYRERKERAERLERLEREDRKADATKKSSSGSRQADSGRSDHGKAGSRQAGVGQTGVGQAGIGQTDNGQARSRQAGVGQTDNGRSEPGSQVKPSKSLDRYARAKLRQRLQDLEKEIADLEEKEEATIGALGDPDTYSKDVSAETLKELNDRLRSIQVRLPEAYREWEEVGSSLEDAPN